MTSVEQLEDETSDLRTRISALQARRANLASILLSTPHLSTRLQQRPVANEHLRRNATKVAKQQSNRTLENLYRACAGVTAYKVQDPDPNAVDSGNILGVRIEVFIGGKFVETYHVLFNRPSARHKTMLKIHRHTIPACIPVRQLANKFLPQSQRDASSTTEQNLVKFGRVLRKELVSWHMRTAAVEKMRQEAGLPDKHAQERAVAKEPVYGQVLNAFVSDDEEEEEDEQNVDEEEEEEEEESRKRRNGPVKIIEIDADMAARQVDIIWSNGQSATIEITKDGEIIKAVVRTEEGAKLSDLETKAIGRIEGLIERLSA